MKPSDQPGRKTSKPGNLHHINWHWIFSVTVLSFFISVSMSYLSDAALDRVDNIVAFLILLLFISIGVVFDIVGVAATATTEKEFHSMAAKKVRGAKEAVWIAHNAGKVSSFCNDVVGDIVGIISGATGAVIIVRITGGLAPLPTLVISLTITGLIAALTIGGKAFGKNLGIGHSVSIVYFVGRTIALLPFSFHKKR